MRTRPTTARRPAASTPRRSRAERPCRDRRAHPPAFRRRAADRQRRHRARREDRLRRRARLHGRPRQARHGHRHEPERNRSVDHDEHRRRGHHRRFTYIQTATASTTASTSPSSAAWHCLTVEAARLFAARALASRSATSCATSTSRPGDGRPPERVTRFDNMLITGVVVERRKPRPSFPDQAGAVATTAASIPGMERLPDQQRSLQDARYHGVCPRAVEGRTGYRVPTMPVEAVMRAQASAAAQAAPG